MGNLSNKCTCFCSRIEVDTNDKIDIMPVLHDPENEIQNRSTIEVLFSENRNSSKEEKTCKVKTELTLKIIKEMSKNLPKVQCVLRGYLFRSKFHKVKTELIEFLNDQISDFQNKFQTLNLIQGELKKGKFNPEGWKQYYLPEAAQMLQYDKAKYGKVYKTKLLINNCLSYYIGEVNIKNQRNGYGVMVDISGTKFEGTWVNHKLCGWGRMIDKDGTVWEGLFINNLLTGRGEKVTLTGISYVGDFISNLKHGHGKEESNEFIYEGEFQKDKKEGQGKITYKTIQDSYEGQFSDNYITGRGFYHWANNHTYEGTFLKGMMHGKGFYKWPDGGEYEGEYVNNLKEGFGHFKWKNGRSYKGTFFRGKPHGSGIMIIEKDKYKVEFLEGKLIKTIMLPGEGDNEKSRPSIRNREMRACASTRAASNSEKRNADSLIAGK